MSSSTSPSTTPQTSAPSRFDSKLPNSTPPLTTIPQRYKSNLTPMPSPLRPHCLSCDRMRLWIPPGESLRKSTSSGDENAISISEDQLNRILEVMGSSWAPSTKETYGAGLLVFQVFCDTHKIPEEKRCPISPSILLAFLSSCAGAYSGSALANYAAGLKAWHLLHGQPWLINSRELKATLDGAAALAPPSSKQNKRNPFTPDIIIRIREHLDLNNPKDAAIFACITTSFYAIARLGEFTVPSLKSFDSTKHITRAHVTQKTDRNHLPVTSFYLPSTKSSPLQGEETYWSAQEGLSDPKAALDNHLRINTAHAGAHLFAWKHPNGLRLLTKKELTKRVSQISSTANLPNLKGHGIRIGGTLEYLLRGVPFDVVKAMGRWSSDAFTIYLRDHAIVIAPYIQASPALEHFTHLTMPPVH
ncbi:hypothetical protein DEU56DRAFT_733239 [Suillus clintonianus]|uniref:uncharacterized protein n=1 Tax=Suillus clintonianus TaxID=1904413 RepID=UPI001B87CE5F|nr:uncharacterized protein DEU56DRAFT_733239 [Suillus clintonianus]KAG2142966.1 hypothetical protein DEU56DRAFT_733239 [Suillus clintonianus]